MLLRLSFVKKYGDDIGWEYFSSLPVKIKSLAYALKAAIFFIAQKIKSVDCQREIDAFAINLFWALAGSKNDVPLPVYGVSKPFSAWLEIVDGKIKCSFQKRVILQIEKTF